MGFKCKIGFAHFNDMMDVWKVKLITMGEEPDVIQDFWPCPFYLRYQRYEDGNPDSPFFLNDWCLFHSHPSTYDLSEIDDFYRVSLSKR